MINPASTLPPAIQELVRNAKAKHGQVFLVKVQLDQGEGQAVIRALTKREADLLDVEHDDLHRQDVMLGLAVLHPSKLVYEEWPAGAVSCLMDQVVHVSGWDLEGLVENMKGANLYAQSMYGSMVAFICAAMQGLKPSDIESMTAHQMSRHLKLAETIHQAPFDFQRWLDPKGWQKKHKMRKLPGRGQDVEIPEGMKVDPIAAAQQMQEGVNPLNDPDASSFDPKDPNSIRRMIQEQRRALG